MGGFCASVIDIVFPIPCFSVFRPNIVFFVPVQTDFVAIEVQLQEVLVRCCYTVAPPSEIEGSHPLICTFRDSVCGMRTS